MNASVITRQLSRRATTVVLLVIIAGLGTGLGGLRLNSNYSAYFDPHDALLQTYQSISKAFAREDSVVVVLDFVDADAFSQPVITWLDGLVQTLKALPQVTAVRSVLDLAAANPDDRAAEEELNQLLGLEPGNATVTLEQARIADDPRAQGLLVSRDGRALLLELNYANSTDSRAAAVVDRMAQLRQTIHAATSRAPGTLKVHYTGTLALNAAYIEVIRHDLKAFLPALLILMGVIMSGIFRSAGATLIMFVVAALAVVAAFGFAGWLGLELAAIDAFAPIIIMSLTLAGSVHLTAAYATGLNAPQPARDAMQSSIEKNLLPLSLTSGTTAAGFLALCVSPSPPVRAMGIIVASGVVMAWALNLSLLPRLLVAVVSRLHSPTFGLKAISKMSRQQRRSIRALFVVLFVVAVVLASGNQINDNVFSYFPSGHTFRSDTDVVQTRFSGINQLVYAFDGGEPYGVFDAAMLHGLRHFSDWLRRQPEVSNVLNITSLPQVQRLMREPQFEQSLRRYRKLAEAHTTAALGITQLVDAHFERTAVSVYLHNLDARAIIAFNQRAERWLRQNADAWSGAGGAGISLIFAHLGQRNALSMVLAFAAALVVISLICGFMLGGTRGAVAGLAVNAFPILAAYAIWSLTDGYISMGGAVVLGMILGIVVDDTLYLLAAWRRALAAGLPAPGEYAVTTVGPALIITSLTLCAGLATGLLSEFAPITAMSTLSVAVIAIALLTDLLVLPALLNTSTEPSAKA